MTEVLLHAIDPDTGDVYPVRVDSSGRLIVGPLVAGSAIIGKVDVNSLPSIPAGSALMGGVGEYAWDGSAWRKQPFTMGYRDRILSRNDMRDSGGDGTLVSNGATNLWTVPASEVWVITTIRVIIMTASTLTLVTFELSTSGVAMPVISQDCSPASPTNRTLNNYVVAKAGDVFRAGTIATTNPITAPYRVVFEINGFKFNTNYS